jgi:hypothetical protein
VIVAGPGGTAERETVRAHGMTDVIELADLLAPSADVAGWPVAAWLAAEPSVASATGIALTPYSAWEPRPTPDPRSAGREQVAAALLEIVGAEGPVLAARAFALLNKAAGGKKLTSVVRAPLSGAAYRLRQQGALEIDGEQETLRTAGSAPVRVRGLGPRTIDEVPPEELTDLLGRLRDAGAADLGRAALDAYGLRRMTAHTEQLLTAAEARLADQESPAG